MARYQIILAYDGTGFAGFQRQARARTVQAEVEQALRQLGWGGKAILSAGRTDSGVHALGQAAAFDLEWPHEDSELCHALNAHLPEDIAVQAALIGRHDFAAFGTPPRANGSTIRTVFSAGWRKDGETLVFEIAANAFLFHMVRRLVAAQVLVGQGRLELEKFSQSVAGKAQTPPGLAPAHGLALAAVEYGADVQE